MQIIKKKISLVFLIVVASLIIIVMMPQDANAVVSETSRVNYTLANGVTESTVYVTDHTGENTIANILRINKGANVSLKASSANYYFKKSTKSSRKKNAKKWSKKKWGYALVSKQAANYGKIKDKVGTVIAACNGDYYEKSKNGQTRGNLILEGNKVRSSKKEPFFAVMKDGTYQIRGKSSSTSGVVEAVSGNNYIVKNGKIVGVHGSRYTQMLIGVTANNDVVIVNVPNNLPGSLGISEYDAACIMQEQGCVDAITFDGGGSASFLTKRSGKKLTLRNTSIDGFPRNVSSALLVVKNKKSNGKKPSGDAVVSMANDNTKLTKTADGVYHYKANGNARPGFVNINGKPYVFDSNGNGITITVKLGKTNYYFQKGALTRTSNGSASKAAMGFCGADYGGTNMLFAYQSDKKALNIGLNPLVANNSGKMADWLTVTAVPWTTVKYKVKGVYVGEGVKNLGNNFMYIPTSPFNDNAKGKKSALKTVSLPSSLNTLGIGSLQNHDHLKKVTIPKNVSKVDKRTFYYAKKLTVTFKGKNPPKFGKEVFKQTAKIKLVVPKNSKWKKALKKNKKKTGFKGTVKYK